MQQYKCINPICGKTIDEEMLRRHIRCPFCGGRVLYKIRNVVKKVKAR